jgi:hypothetical protein
MLPFQHVLLIRLIMKIHKVSNFVVLHVLLIPLIMKIHNMVGFWDQFNSFYMAMVIKQNILLKGRFGVTFQ